MTHDTWSSASEDQEQFNQMLMALLSRVCLVYGVSGFRLCFQRIYCAASLTL